MRQDLVALYERVNQVYSAQLGEIAWHEIALDTTIDDIAQTHTTQVKQVIEQTLGTPSHGTLRFLEVAPYRHYTAQQIAEHYGAQAHAFDISPDSLRMGSQLAMRAGVRGHAVCTAGDFHSLPYADNFFDVVFIASAIHHTWRPQVVIAELLRVLRPKGILIIDNEPVGSKLCLYRFRSNRMDQFTGFEKALHDGGLLHIVSSPFLGSRPEELFGMIENDRIPLETWEQSIQGCDILSWQLDPILSKFQAAVENAKNGQVNDARAVLKLAFERARPLLDPRVAQLGFSLPSDPEIDHLLANAGSYAVAMETAHSESLRARYRADAFGAALRAVVRKRGEAGLVEAPQVFRRPVPMDGDVYVDLPESDKIVIGLKDVILPAIDPRFSEALGHVFPTSDWNLVTEESGTHSQMNLGSAAVINLPARREDGVLLLRYYAVASVTRIFKIVCLADGAVDEHTVVQSESRLVRLPVHSSAKSVSVLLSYDDGTPANLPWHVRVSVCRLVPIRWKS